MRLDVGWVVTTLLLAHRAAGLALATTSAQSNHCACASLVQVATQAFAPSPAAADLSRPLGPCPCLELEEQQRQVRALVKRAEETSIKDVEETANSTANYWVAGMEHTGDLAGGALSKVASQELVLTKQTVKAEMDRETEQINQMMLVVEEAKRKARAEVGASAQRFAMSQAQNRMARVLNITLESAIAMEAETEEARRDAARPIQVTLATATQMLKVAHEADMMVTDMQEAHAEDVAMNISNATQRSLDQVKRNKLMLNMATKVVTAAHNLAEQALRRAIDSENQAGEALNRARSNSIKIQKLKQKAAQVQQQADAAAEAAKGSGS